MNVSRAGKPRRAGAWDAACRGVAGARAAAASARRIAKCTRPALRVEGATGAVHMTSTNRRKAQGHALLALARDTGAWGGACHGAAGEVREQVWKPPMSLESDQQKPLRLLLPRCRPPRQLYLCLTTMLPRQQFKLKYKSRLPLRCTYTTHHGGRGATHDPVVCCIC